MTEEERWQLIAQICQIEGTPVHQMSDEYIKRSRECYGI